MGARWTRRRLLGSVAAVVLVVAGLSLVRALSLRSVHVAGSIERYDGPITGRTCTAVPRLSGEELTVLDPSGRVIATARVSSVRERTFPIRYAGQVVCRQVGAFDVGLPTETSYRFVLSGVRQRPAAVRLSSLAGHAYRYSLLVSQHGGDMPDFVVGCTSPQPCPQPEDPYHPAG